MKEINLLKELTSPEVSSLNPKKWLIAWPIASLEQHGPFLPLGTDGIILDYIIDQVRKQLQGELPVIFGPMLPLGKSIEHLGFAGTISLSAITLLRIVEDIVVSLVAHGFQRLVFINGHGGNTDILHAMGPDLRYKYGIYIYYIDLWGSTFFDDIIQDLFPKLTEADIHAASAETSVLLYIRPDLVTLASARHSLDKSSKKLQIDVNSPLQFGWLAQDVGQSGVVGDPSYASAEAGKQIVKYAIQKICDLLKEIN